MTAEDRVLRREILRNFIANTKISQRDYGRHTSMQMTLPEEEKNNQVALTGTPLETTEQSVQREESSGVRESNKTDEKSMEVNVPYIDEQDAYLQKETDPHSSVNKSLE